MRTRILEDRYEFAISGTPSSVTVKGRLLKQCKVCGRVLPLSAVGFRNMKPDGSGGVRDQPRCGRCRHLTRADGAFEREALPTIIGDIVLHEYERPRGSYAGYIEHANPSIKWVAFIRLDGGCDFYPDRNAAGVPVGRWQRSKRGGTR